jgi:hypothetical protein
MTYMRKKGSQQMMKVPTMTAMVRATFFSCTGLNVQPTELTYKDMSSISWLTNSALVYEPKCGGRGGGGVARGLSQ